jgi:enoyl-CoA hydratase/carnithine racemase
LIRSDLGTKNGDRVARIRFDRAEKKNAFTGEMYIDLAKALAAADADPHARAILLHGSADCFTAGNDIGDFLKPREGEPPVWNVFKTLPSMRKPVVAAVGGPAVGIGTTLLLHCDLVYAADNARFQLPFVSLGIVPEFGSTFLLPFIAGYQRAAELLLLGQPFTAQKAHEVGIVTAVVSQEDLFPEAEKAAIQLASLPPESIRITKRLMKTSFETVISARIMEEGRLVVERLRSPEAKEAMNAFLEKRKPDFSRF